MATLTLTGPQTRQFSEALRDAFPHVQRLDEFLLYALDLNRQNISLGADLPAIVFDLLRDARARNYTDRLLVAARAANPGNAALAAFAGQFGLGPPVAVDNAAPVRAVAGATLERKIVEANGQLDVVEWRTKLGRLEGQVCRVEHSSAMGTGFLVGRDLLMTNYHVMAAVIDGTVKPSDVRLRFDYKTMNDRTVNQGTVYALAADWLVDRSPFSQADLSDPAPRPPAPDELDYALLALAGAPGEDPMGGAANKDPQAAPRGHVAMPSAPHDFLARPAVFIMQHPDGAPLTLALDTAAVIRVNENGTRVRYRTNTEAGSSGAPCFDADWNWIALHHAGDPRWTPTYNQGVPAGAIVSLLKERKLLDRLG